MKKGLSLQEMAAEIERQSRLKEDYLVDTRNLWMEPFDARVYLHMRENGTDAVEPLEIGQIAHRQLGAQLKIPAAYYDRMRTDYPELLAQNVNAWFQREPATRMIRTMAGMARAFLSNRYRRIDNLQVAQTVLPILGEMQGIHFESCQITDSRMYLKVVNTRLEAEVAPGDIVQAGIIISNSEVGQGSVCVQPLVYRLVCSNGMVVNDAQTRRNHVGRVNDAGENFLLYSDETLAADDHAFLLKLQDTVRAAVDEARFSQVVGLMQNAKQAAIEAKDIVLFRPVVGRVAVKQGIGTIVDSYQAFKIQMLNYDPVQPLLHRREVGQHVFKASFGGSKGISIAPEAHLYEVKAAGGTLDIRQPADLFLLHAIKEKLSRLWQHREFFGQCRCMVLNAAVNIDQFTVRIIEHLQLARSLTFSKEHPSCSSKDFNVSGSI